MRRVLLDTNIYGEMLFDPRIGLLKNTLLTKSTSMLVYGFTIVRKELRDTSKKVRIEGRNLRIALLLLYDEIVKSRTLKMTENDEKNASSYYKTYRSIGGMRSWKEIKNDFLIVAGASRTGMDVVVSEDEKTMLSEIALKVYGIINNALLIRTPKFVNYEEFKRWFS